MADIGGKCVRCGNWTLLRRDDGSCGCIPDQPSTEGAGGRLVEALRELASMRCSDGYCDLAGRATGMHTNGGCRCLGEIRSPRLRVRIRCVLDAARRVASPRPEETGETTVTDEAHDV